MANGNDTTGWMSDVQRAIALILIVSFAAVTLFATGCSIFWPSAAAVTDMAKTLQAAMVNMALIALGFFFGSSMAKQASDVRQQDIMEKMAPAAPNIPALASAAEVKSWWTLFDNDETAKIVTASEFDDRVKAIIAAAKDSKATPADLDYLVSKNLLSPDRANTIQKV